MGSPVRASWAPASRRRCVRLVEAGGEQVERGRYWGCGDHRPPHNAVSPSAVFNVAKKAINGIVEGQYDPGRRGIIRCYLPTNISDRVNVENGGPGICEVDCPATGDFRFG